MLKVIFLALILVQSCSTLDINNQDLLDFALNPKNVIKHMISNLTEDLSLCQLHSQVYFGHLEATTDLLLPQNSWALKSKCSYLT